MHRSSVSRERIGLGATYLLCVRYLPSTYQPCKWQCMCMQSVSNRNLSNLWRKYRKKIGNPGQY